MLDTKLRKAIGARIKELRKQNRWSQKELAEKLNVRFSHLNKYEGGFHMPPVEKLLHLAEIFDTNVDYLLTGASQAEHRMHNSRLIKRLEELQELPKEEQEAVLALLDAMILKHRVQGAMRPIDKKRKTGTK